MKRSAALIALSHDHHHALDVARRLRRAGAVDFDAARAYLLEFWEPRGRRHFEIEEHVLLTAIDDTDAEWLAAVQRVREEHDRIRQQVAGIDAAEDAHALGQLLHDHVRFEERHLFPMLESRLSEDELARLAKAIEREERA
jgi:hemerythrin-like domain-containing protein